MSAVKSFEIDGHPAVIYKQDRMGHLCGYIGVPEGHNLYGKHYDDEAVPGGVHGGWTYSEDRTPNEEPDGYWYFGFDCAHVGDLVPALEITFDGDVLRDATFVKDELRRAAAEIKRSVLIPRWEVCNQERP